jgi:hypothetical protein
LINVNGDLFGATLGSDVLSVHELRAPALAGKPEEVSGYQRHGPPRAFLPRRIGGRVDDDLADDPPARMVRIAARHKKPRERLCYAQRPWLGPVAVEMSKCGADVATTVDRPG